MLINRAKMVVVGQVEAEIFGILCRSFKKVKLLIKMEPDRMDIPL